MYTLLKKQRTAFLSMLVCCTLLFILPTTSLAQSKPQQQKGHILTTLNGLADQFYIAAKAEDIGEARKHIVAINDLVVSVPFDGLATVEGVEALLETIISAKQVFAAISLEKQDAIVAAAKVRLAVDALSHPKNPMWLQYYNVLKADGLALHKAVNSDDKAQISAALQRMLAHYAIIRPALLINRAPSEVNKLDSYLKYLHTEPSVILKKGEYELMLSELFERQVSSTYVELQAQQQVSMLWTAVIGGLIISVLGYVAWRKYEYI